MAAGGGLRRLLEVDSGMVRHRVKEDLTMAIIMEERMVVELPSMNSETEAQKDKTEMVTSGIMEDGRVKEEVVTAMAASSLIKCMNFEV